MRKKQWLSLFLTLALLIMPVLGGAEVPTYRNITVSDDGTHVDFGTTYISDMKKFYAFLEGHPEITHVDMYTTKLSVARLEELLAKFPQISFGCTYRFARGYISTNTETYSTWNTPNDTRYPSKKFAALKYCSTLKALDLGHNHIRELDFIEHLKDLKILILAVNDIDDISVIGTFQNLEYLELFNNDIMDLSPLKGLKHLQHLNLCHNPFTDISPLLEMKQLKRLWLSDNYLTDEQKATLASALPDCKIWYAWSDCTGGGWRREGHSAAVVKMFKTGQYSPLPE